MLRIALLALPLLGPVAAAAQGLSISPFAASDGGLTGAPGLVGLAATAWIDPVGVRLGGAVDAGYSPLAPALGLPPASDPSAWSADLDLVVPGRALGVTIGSVEPVAFVGLGAHGQRLMDGSTATIVAWSYGGGASVELARWLGLEAEARYRMPHQSDAAQRPAGMAGGWEMRAGFSVHLGRSRGRRASPARVTGSRVRPGRAPGTAGATAAGTAGVDGTGSASATAGGTLSTADRYVGVPYVWGGSTPAEGFDCSGFVQYVFARNGVRLPRVSRDQAGAGRALPVSRQSLLPGDLMFFAGSDGVVSHVAIYVGDDRIIHSSGSRGAVGYDDLGSRRARWYATHFVAARRVLPTGSFRLDSGFRR